MSIVDIALDLENLPDQMLQQLGQGGDPRYPQYLVMAEAQRRKDMRDRFQAQQAKQQAANPPSIAEQRMAELGGGIPSADPNMGAPPDPSLQTGIAGPPPGGPPPGGPSPMMASGGLIQGYQAGGGGFGDPDDDPLIVAARQQAEAIRLGEMPDPQAEQETEQDYIAYVQGLPMNRPEESILTREEFQAQRQRVRDKIPLPPARERGEPWETGGPGAHEDIRWRLAEQERLTEERDRLAEFDEIIADPDISDEERAWIIAQRDLTFDPGIFSRERPMRASDVPEYTPLRQLQMFGGRPRGGTPRPYDNRQQLQDMYDNDEISEEEYIAGMNNLLTGSAALDPVTGERLAGDEEQEIDSIQAVLDALEGGGTGRDQQDVWDEMRERIESYEEGMGESELERTADEAERAAVARRLEQAGGIRSLDLERLTEQERLLAKGLGISEDRVAELLREMDTPEQIEDRRKAAGWGGLSQMFLSPDLATGIGGMGERIRTMDDKLRDERKTALTEIRAERQTGFDFEDLKRKGIFDVKRRSQQEYDTAELAIANMEATIAKARAERGFRGQREALLAHMDLLGSQAEQIGAWNREMAQVDANIRTAMMSRESELAQSGNWENIADNLTDIKNSLMMENPAIAKWVEDTERIMMMAKVKQWGGESRAIMGGTPSTTITSSRTTNPYLTQDQE